MTAGQALRIEGLSFSYTAAAKTLDDVSLEVAAGTFCVLLGANGAGKTTLYALITRLYNAPAGEIRVQGHDLKRESREALSAIGVVFQRPTLDLDLTVEQNLRYHAALHGVARSQARVKIGAGLSRHGLEGLSGRKINRLSGGQRRRVELARALLHEPSLLLMDEPTVGLDISSRGEFIEHVRTLCRERQVGVLWATHLVDEATGSDQLVVLHEGRVLRTGTVSDVVAATGCDNLGDAFGVVTGTRQSGG